MGPGLRREDEEGSTALNHPNACKHYSKDSVIAE